MKNLENSKKFIFKMLLFVTFFNFVLFFIQGGQKLIFILDNI